MGSYMQSNRSVFITVAAIMVIILYLNSLMQRQHEIAIQKTLSETLQILRDIDTGIQTSVNAITESAPTVALPVPKNTVDEFSVADHGFWQGLGAMKGHLFDRKLAEALLQFFKAEQVTTLLELGAGTGTYAKLFMAKGILTSCYDGNPQTQELSEGRCAVVDLSKPIAFSKSDWTLSLEVGEHIPQQFEDAFLDNLDRGNRFGLVLSWAVEGQGGTSHINERNNSYIRDKIVSKGYNSDFEAEKSLRKASHFFWFKNTIMVFRRQVSEA